MALQSRADSDGDTKSNEESYEQALKFMDAVKFKPDKPLGSLNWSPDWKACGLCKDKFGLRNRRHHCRGCGWCVDTKCSNHNLVIPALKEKGYETGAVRVCDRCFFSSQHEEGGSFVVPAAGVPQPGKDDVPVLDDDRRLHELMHYDKTKKLGPLNWAQDWTGCGLCKTKFAPTNRRHHCRGCGWCVCADCSKHKLVVPALRDRNWFTDPTRVCTQCWATAEYKEGEVLQVNAKAGTPQPSKALLAELSPDKAVDIKYKPDEVYMEGYLKKLGEVHREWRLRYFVITTDTCYYYNSRNKQMAGKASGAFSLAGAKTVRFPAEKYGNAMCFGIMCTAVERVYVIQASDATAFEDWVRNFDEAIRRARHIEATAVVSVAVPTPEGRKGGKVGLQTSKKEPELVIPFSMAEPGIGGLARDP